LWPQISERLQSLHAEVCARLAAAGNRAPITNVGAM
jgi:hypothetical protein